jgi:hypothetical protein
MTRVKATLNQRPEKWKDIAAMGVTSIALIGQQLQRIADVLEEREARESSR